MFGGSSNRDTARSTNQQSSSSQTTPPSTTTQAATGNTPPSQGTQGSSESGPGAAGFGTGGAGGIGGGIFDEGGPPSLFRLLTPDLGSQVGWLLPLALMGLLAMTWQERFRLPLNRWHLGLALWGVWFLACGTFFSVAGFFHSYYLVIIAPAICALTGIGLVTMWREYRTLPLNKRRTWALPIALIFTAIEQVHMLSFYQPYDSILIPLVIIVSVVVVLLLLVTKLNIQLRFNRNLLSIIQRPAVVVCMIAFLLAPTVWTVITVLNPTNETVPTAGPTITSVNSATAAMLNQFAQYLRTEYGIPGAGGTGIEGNPLAGRSGVSGMPGAFGSETTVNTKLVNYLEQNKGNAKYLVAYSSSSEAAPLIIQTGQPVMSLGGFLGSDPILTQSQLQQLIKAGTIRFFMLSGNRTAGTTGSSANNSNQTSGAGNISGGGIAIGGGIMGSGSNAQLISWVESNCKPVSSALWETQQQSSNTSPQRGGFGGMNQTLYDCATIKTQS
jgi:4-amino-4-deoxy-L-arabinose transferase-like glycosyltransferase